MKSQVQHYNIILSGKAALLAQEYHFLRIDAQGTFWKRINKIKKLQEADAKWTELIIHIDDLYPEFKNNAKSFDIIHQRHSVSQSVMEVSKTV